jgi:hypothetical protein
VEFFGIGAALPRREIEDFSDRWLSSESRACATEHVDDARRPAPSVAHLCVKACGDQKPSNKVDRVERANGEVVFTVDRASDDDSFSDTPHDGAVDTYGPSQLFGELPHGRRSEAHSFAEVTLRMDLHSSGRILQAVLDIELAGHPRARKRHSGGQTLSRVSVRSNLEVVRERRSDGRAEVSLLLEI